MKKGDIVAANEKSFFHERNAVGEVLKICGGAMPHAAIVRFHNGWKEYRDQIVSISAFRIIPKGE